MEPVFDRLGMVLVSANRAQGGMGTLQSALAGKGIYGENDFVLWDSSMTEKDGNAQDVFFRQALISGQRVPILFDMGGGKTMIDTIHNEAGAHVGGVSSAGFNPKFKNTTIDFGEKKYNAACWTDRVDITPEVQYPGFGGQKSWHPGNWVHQSTARKISLVFLHALDEALTLWEKAASEDGGNPLDGKHWHLQSEEDAIREKLQKVDVTTTGCGKLFPTLPRICTTPMNGAEEWSPMYDPVHNSIRALAKPAPSGYVPGILGVQEQAYPGRDPLMPSQRVPKGEVDVATIARSLPPQKSSQRRSLFSMAHQRHRYAKHHASNTSSTLTQQKRIQPLRAYNHGRHLDGESKIIPGEGWATEGHPAGYCDGTSNAICYREKTSHCLMSSHNDARGHMKGDALSGWLVLQLKDVTSGLFMARMEPYHQYKTNKRTDGWTEVNNGRKDDRRRGRRKLKAPPPPLLGQWEVAVNGVIVHSWNNTEFGKLGTYWIGYNNGFVVLWNDEEWAQQNKTEDVEFAFRIRGDDGRNALMTFTHVYYA